jgi:hypothetical protein
MPPKTPAARRQWPARFLCRTHHHLADLLAGGRVEDRLNALA